MFGLAFWEEMKWVLEVFQQVFLIGFSALVYAAL
jgi:hypothetical protein